MPTLSIFFGIVVRMWHDDHPPAHIHAEYQGFEALVSIDTGEVIQGKLPTKAARILKEWCATHNEELRNNWIKAQNYQTLDRIQGADYD